MTRSLVILGILVLLAGCQTIRPELPLVFKAPENPFCRALYDNNDWLDGAVDTENRWGLPLHIALAELNMDVGTEAVAYIRPLESDWIEYRIATENWSGTGADIETALDFLGWHAQMATDRNDLTMDDAGQLYIASRIGHGEYYRLEYSPNLLLQSKAGQVDQRAEQYRQDLKSCPRIRERAGSFFRWPW